MICISVNLIDSCLSIICSLRFCLVNYEFLDIFDDKTIDKEFVKKRRVEIDAVLEQVGDERLWEYIMEELT
jgi:hypothetical protein